MIHRIIYILFIILFSVCQVQARASQKTSGELVPVEAEDITTIRVVEGLAVAETCMVRHDQGIVYRIDDWVMGNELYKGYCDPAAACGTNAYPYTITEINMPMYFAAATQIYVAVDIEQAILTGGCTQIGDMLAISSEYEITIPGSRVFMISGFLSMNL